MYAPPLPSLLNADNGFQAMATSDNPLLSQKEIRDPTLFCTAFKRPRFFLFTKDSPEYVGISILRSTDDSLARVLPTEISSTNDLRERNFRPLLLLLSYWLLSWAHEE